MMSVGTETETDGILLETIAEGIETYRAVMGPEDRTSSQKN
jgi:hypothetical protein